MRFPRAGVATCGMLAVALLISGGVGSASADAASDGLWYFDAFHVAEAQAAGLNGAGVTIAVIDSPVNTAVPTLASADVDVQSPSRCWNSAAGDYFPATSTALTGLDDAIHGTEVLSLIAGSGAGYNGKVGVKGVAPGSHVLYYATAFGDASDAECASADGGDGFTTAIAAAITDAVGKGAKVISVSLGTTALPELDEAVALAHRKGVVIVAALPNSMSDSGVAPASANGVVAVQAIDRAAAVETGDDGTPNSFPFTTVAGPGVKVIGQGGETWDQTALGSGTSFAAPIIAGFLAVVLQKYPHATGNQLIQTLVHNTGGGNANLAHDDSVGYGIASLTTMLTVDPATYPDTNPLLTDDGNPPTLAQIAGTPSATPAPPSGDTPGGSGVGSIVPLVVGILIGLLVLAGIIAFIVVLAVRRARTSKNTSN